MKSLKVLALLALLTAAAFPALAADEAFKNPYYGFEFNYQTLDNGDDSVHPLALSAKIGGFLHPNIAAEARLGFGIASDTASNIDYLNDYYIGAYARGVAQVDKLSPYLIAGFTAAKASASGTGVSTSENKSGFSFGLGADYKLCDRCALSFEWMKLIDKEDLELSAISVGVKYDF